MYFKKMELQGFKSFAEPVVIDFNQGITCIVGPNGSGKSNISDAIRWVLGEQSPKMLRGGKMEDVIFAGTANRKSRGMAEVTLTIDNSDHQLPIDYTEVAITRRMYRSGESEYLINKMPCRLKDIRELIMDTGIGVDGYSIIGQGKIADIVSNKPESRRELFEEAAGIVKYRSKKEETERKLDDSKKNMETVSAVIAEIDGRIDSLREDSIKAKEYLELKERYKSIEINVVLKHIADLELKNEYVKDEIMEADADMQSMSGEKEAIDQEVRAARERSMELENLGTETQEKLMAVVDSITALSGRSTMDQARLESIDKEKERIALEQEGLKAKREREAGNCADLQKNREAIFEDLKIHKADLEEKNKSLEGMQISASENAHRAEEARKKALEVRAAAARNAGDLRLRIERASERRKVIAEMEEAHEGYSYAVRFLMSKKLPGLFGAVGELIDVPKGYETAVETALGAGVQNIVVQEDGVAQTAIRLLKENKAGRLTFLPLNTIKPNVPEYEDRIRKMNGFRGFAAELVQCDPRYGKAIDFLLGRAVICDTLQNAVSMSKSITSGFRFVTLEGDVVTAQGAMTGGSAKNNTAGLLERKGEAKKLEELIRTLEKELQAVNESAGKDAQAAERQAEELTEEAREQQGDLESYGNSLTDARLKVQALEKDLENADELIHRVETAIREIEEEEAQKVRDLEKLEQEKNAILSGSGGLLQQLQDAEKEKKRLEDLDKDTKEERLKILQVQEETEKQKEAIDRRYNEAAERKQTAALNQARNDTALENYKQRLWDDFEVSYVQAMEFQREDFVMSAAVRESREIKNRMKELGDVNVGAIQEYATVSERHQFLTTQRDDLQAAMDALQQIITEMDKNIKKSFTESFNAICDNFATTFTELFGGGTAELRLEDENEPLTCGIEIVAQPPGKKLQNMNLLSGGEKTMTAIALMFAILKTKPTPFCILDEVEAALDEINIEQFAAYLHRGFGNIQFALITHQKRTMEHADVLYGITMPERGISKVLSLKLGDEFEL